MVEILATNNVRDETLSKITLLAEASMSILRKSNLPHKGGVYKLKNFEAELWRQMLDFWRKGENDRLSAKFLDDRGSFVLYMGERRIVLEDYAGLKIEEYLNENSEYPHFQSTWTGEETEKIPKGTLTFFRVDFSGSLFVSYDYRGGSYDIYNPRQANLAKLGLPEDLNQTSSVLGQSIIRRIDFAKRKEEILEISGLEELNREICGLC